MMGLKIAFAFAISITLIYGGAVDFKLCPDETTTGLVSNVIVSDCTRFPCTFVKGQNYSIEIDFENFKKTDSLKVEVYGIIAGVTFPWPGLDSNGCNHIWVGWCPMNVGDYVTFGMAMRVDPFYPSTDAELRWIIKGDDDLPIFCWEIPVRLI